tara:strand:+ start:2936 stop:3766 length:831 start_codon:yes stop_codon:yes gene_type:complete
MSRFDRRLKGKRPGESTCALEGVPRASFENMNWQQTSQNFTNQMQSNIMNIRSAQTQQLQNPNIPTTIQGSVSRLNDSPLLSQTQPSLQEKTHVEALEMKNAKLQNVAATTTDPSMRLLSLHEIRLNRLEYYGLKKTDFGNISNDEIYNGLMENKIVHMENKLKLLFETTKNEFKIKYDNMNDNYNKKLLELKEENKKLHNTLRRLEHDITKIEVKKEVSTEINKPKTKLLDENDNIEMKIEDKKKVFNIPFDSGNDDEEIKKMVKEAITKVEMEK